MNLQAIALALGIAVCFGGWPILAKTAKLSSHWVALIVLTASLVPTLLVGLSQKQYTMLPPMRGFAIVALAGLLNGVAFYFYSKMVNNKEIPTAQFIVMIAVLATIVVPLISWAMEGSAPTARQWSGYALAAVAVYLLSA